MLALYGHPFSSHTWKALVALYANGTAFEFRTLDGWHRLPVASMTCGPIVIISRSARPTGIEESTRICTKCPLPA